MFNINLIFNVWKIPSNNNHRHFNSLLGEATNRSFVYSWVGNEMVGDASFAGACDQMHELRRIEGSLLSFYCGC